MGKNPSGKEIELEPDAWERFERAVRVVAKSSPQHRTKKKDSSKRKKGSKHDKERTKDTSNNN